jgi:16S rRNA (adenine(1408)-N(1))-methyltransferase
VGLDAVAAPMADASRRAARPAARGGRPNVLFVVAGVEVPPVELVGRADLVTVDLPWGSLLRGVLGLDARAAAGLASLVRPGGALEALVSIEPRDGLGDLLGHGAADDRLATAWAGLEFRLTELRPAEPREVLASGSSWARRLGATAGDRRRVTRLCLRRLP